MLRLTVQPVVSPRFYRFGPNVLDALRGVLWQQGVQLPLTPRVLDILVVLVSHHGEVVTKEDFMRLVWHGAAVEDNNLARQISTLRKLLHETPDQREYIVTVSGLGYRFVGDLTTFDELPAELLTLVGHPTHDERAPQAGQSAVGPGSDPAPAVLATPLPAVDTRPRPEHRSWLREALLIAAVGSIVAVVALAWPDRGTNAAPVSRSLWQFSYGGGSYMSPSWAPDGSRIATASDREGNFDIWIHEVADDDPLRLTSSPANDWQAAWSPDGESIAFRSERAGGGIYVAPATGGAERLLASFGSMPRWSPDGRAILFSHVAPGSAGSIRPYIVTLDRAGPYRFEHAMLDGLRVTSVNWAPDGRVSVWASGGGRQRFLTIPLGDGPVTSSRLPAEIESGGGPSLTTFAWNPNGRFLYFEGRSDAVHNLWRVSVNPDTLDWLGAPERLTVGPGDDMAPTPSPDGSRLAFTVNSTRPGVWAFTFEPLTGALTPFGDLIAAGQPGNRGADISRDGTRLLYRLERSDRHEIWERQVDGPARLLVSRAGWWHSLPHWSPDGVLATYLSSRRSGVDEAEDRRVVVLDTRRPAPHERVVSTLAAHEEFVPTGFAPDMQSILGQCRRDDAPTIGTCAMTLAGTPVIQPISSNPDVQMFQQRYSPDGRWISFIGTPAADRSTSAIYVMPAEGGAWLALTDGRAYDDKPRWSPDGRILYYISNRDGRFEVWGQRFDPDAGVPIDRAFRVTSFERSRLILSPHLRDMEMFVTARRIFLPMLEVSSRIWMLDQVDR